MIGGFISPAPVRPYTPHPTAEMPGAAGRCCARAVRNDGCPIPAESILHRASAGDSNAVKELIARFGGLVWSLARRVGLPDSETEDAVHEVFTELWRNGYRYDANIASETAFVATIARRRLIDRRRRVSRQPIRQQLTEAEPARERSALRTDLGEDAAKAAKAFETLSAEQQRVLRLSVYEGLSHELIARATGLPLGTVKTHARRGLIRLRELLGFNPDNRNGDAPAGARPALGGA